MDIFQILRNYSEHPITHQILLSIFKDYKRPNDKINELVKKGMLESVKKGLYVAGPKIGVIKPEPFLLANHILGPSYVSSDSALSYHGLIPEKVYGVTSMTTKTTRHYATPLGIFSYNKLQIPYYAFGLQIKMLDKDQFILMASPEKALLDKVIITKGIILRSKSSAVDFLLENLRLDENYLKELNIHMMKEWIEESPKRDSISFLIKAIEDL